ncbi:hypothetical protein F7725_003528 [Dissostichus mawsoni]|uniref:Uncharacterized protein n=1 Tax=Dissostichus mawsoni TaxID=36200 RepID=A0A7J5YAJ2_DISMA|nr:hypothetical protein F7725_003528 [Dissostichus mawsoni]
MRGVMEGLQLSWKRRGAEHRSRGKVKLLPPPPVTTDSTVSSCSGQLLQNGCRGSAANENLLNASWPGVLQDELNADPANYDGMC